MKANRSIQAGIIVLDGQQILKQGHELAQKLWNYTRHCAIGNSWHLAQVRGDIPRRGSVGKYLGKFGMQKALQDYPAYRDLSDRCASYTIADFDIAMRSWFSNLKNNPKARPPRRSDKPRTLTFEIGRNAKHLLDWTFRLTVLGGHIDARHCFVRLIVPQGIKVKDAKLIRIKPDGQGVLCIHKEFKPANGDSVAAIDLGIVNIACLAFENGDSILYSGAGLLDVFTYWQGKARKCKPSGWAGKGEQNSRMSQRKRDYLRRGRNIRQLALHNITRHIIDECDKRGVDTLVVGDLSNLANPNEKFAQWLRGEMLRQLIYKGEEVGIIVEKISEAWTSQTCASCGTKANRGPRGILTCQNCGAVWNSDFNGAVNILNRYRLGKSLGVGGDFPTPPSLAETAPGIGKVFTQMHPRFVAKCDFRTDCHIEMRETGYEWVHMT